MKKKITAVIFVKLSSQESVSWALLRLYGFILSFCDILFNLLSSSSLFGLGTQFFSEISSFLNVLITWHILYPQIFLSTISSTQEVLNAYLFKSGFQNLSITDILGQIIFC